MPANHRYSFRSVLQVSALTVVLSAALTACSSWESMTSGLSRGVSTSTVNPVNWVTPYKVDVIQGNFVSKAQIDLLKVGMSRVQVQELLGTALVTSVFHGDRWDYVFTLKRQGVEPQTFKYTVYFKDDRVLRFDGDAMPSEADFVATLATRRSFGKPPVLQATEEQLKSVEKSAAPSPTRASPDARAPSSSLPEPSAKVYPPLESPKP